MPDQTPQADRPRMPGYDLLDADSGSGLLPWSWAEERLINSHNYWISTVSPEGRPHAMPVWGVWMDGVLYFSTADNSRKARNLAADSRCTATTEYAGEAVIVEGTAEIVTDAGVLTRFKEAYDPKYDWDMDVSTGPIYAIKPRVAFGFIESAADFQGSATRWRFG
ncbi:MAG: pyridoxamine 5'-phosphate oxidase family protein [Chloroflexi bacterium]|nr:pyridoxamine 5'-phosphate oxidase family protein [Chloroflexota bacterium]